MNKKALSLGIAALSVLSAVPRVAGALSQVVSVVQKGDFALIGNTLVQDCGMNALPYPAGAKCSGIMAGDLADRAPDIFWQVSGMSTKADDTIAMDQSSSAAVLSLPADATVTHAFLLWSARAQSIGQNDDKVDFECMGQAPIEVTASLTYQKADTYHGYANVTAYVQQYGACTYKVSGVTAFNFNSYAQPDASGHSAWWMVVLYSSPSMPHRHLTLFQGLDDISNGGLSDSLLTGLVVPKNFNAYASAKVGVVGYEGSVGLAGDQFLLVDPVMMTSDALTDNSGNEYDFFNGTHSYLGASYSQAGDLPSPAGSPGTMSQFDMDVVDITGHLLSGGQTQLQLMATSVEPVLVAGIVSSIPTFSDADMDGLSDDEEEFVAHLNPNDADSDDDGVLDQLEGCATLSPCPSPAWAEDTDGDGLINALDPDSDNDGLFDGTELGLDCNDPATDASRGHCRADADNKTTTNPLDLDSDDGGVGDGSEDANLDGRVDAGETDPASPADDPLCVDSDGDGLSDAMELMLNLGQADVDSDDDGVPDGEEANPSDDTDGDGLVNSLDVDSDNDGLFDGTEIGRNCNNLGLPAVVGHCTADADLGATTTSPVNADSDQGGTKDGAEDLNLNGAKDGPNETDPTVGHPEDDLVIVDNDKDGLSNMQEIPLGINPDDADSDDDGLPDGLEPNPYNDEDKDGVINALDADSDDDGLFDGTEMGFNCSNPDTNTAANHCIADGDKGNTTTGPLLSDTDRGGLSDGCEDANKNGVYDAAQGEQNALDPSDDVGLLTCDEDTDCGAPHSEVVCVFSTSGEGSCVRSESLCLPGCRTDDNCPSAQVCQIEAGSEIGLCVEATSSSSSSGGGGEGSCLCELMVSRESGGKYGLMLMFAVCAAWVARRRERME